jgi:hypothetical protein
MWQQTDPLAADDFFMLSSLLVLAARKYFGF